MHVAVIGSGYVGLVAGACLAETGNDVVCVDKDAEKIARLQKNEIPIYEPGLEPMVRRNQEEGRLTFTTDLGAAVRAARVVFIAVGTPPGEDGSADLQHVLGGGQGDRPQHERPQGRRHQVHGAGRHRREGARRRSSSRDRSRPFAVCSNPEFLKEGAAIDDFMKPDRVVIGVDDEEAKAVMGELYAPFTRQGGNRVLFMDIASAEVTKYAANAMLATRISFMNQMARFCELVGADVQQRAARHRLGPAHRARVPLSGPRLRRLLLSQGREGDHPHRRLARPVARRAQGGRGGERGAEAGGPAQDAQVPRAAT